MIHVSSVSYLHWNLLELRHFLSVRTETDIKMELKLELEIPDGP